MASRDFAIGQMIDGRYQIETFLGAGAFGTVWRALEVVRYEVFREVAVKLMPVDPGDLRSQLSELRMSLRLEHENLIRCYSCGECAIGPTQYLYLVMQLATGGSLLEPHGGAPLSEAPLSEGEALRLANALAEGLAYLHSQGCVHRDLKPGNILRVGEQWKISDFGLVRNLGASGARSLSRQFVGTPAYAPPEVYRDVPYNTAWDIWSFGVILVEARSGRRPFRGNSDEALMLAVLNSTPDFHNLTGRLRTAIEGCLVRQPAERLTISQISAILNSRGPQTSQLRQHAAFGRRFLPLAILLILVAGICVLLYRALAPTHTAVPLVQSAERKPPQLPKVPDPLPIPENPDGVQDRGEPARSDQSQRPVAAPAVAKADQPNQMHSPPIDLPRHPDSEVQPQSHPSHDLGLAHGVPDFTFTLLAYKQMIRGGEVFDPTDSRLSSLYAVVEPQGSVPADAEATIKWIASETPASETHLSGAGIAGRHKYDNVALPGKLRVELWVKGITTPRVIEFTVKNF